MRRQVFSHSNRQSILPTTLCVRAISFRPGVAFAVFAEVRAATRPPAKRSASRGAKTVLPTWSLDLLR